MPTELPTLPDGLNRQPEQQQLAKPGQQHPALAVRIIPPLRLTINLRSYLPHPTKSKVPCPQFVYLCLLGDKEE
jgi:hypothetical protein